MNTLEPLVSDTDIYGIVESVCVDDATIDVWEVHRLMIALRDEYEAERAALHEAATAALGWIDEIYPAAVFDGSSGDEGPIRIVAIRENLRQALGEAQP